MKLNEIDERLRTARSEYADVVDEMEDLNAGERTPGRNERMKRLNAAGERLCRDLEKLETRRIAALEDQDARMAKLAQFASRPEYGEAGTSPNPYESASGPTLLRGRDPWSQPAMQVAPDELRSRALDAVERSEDAPDEGRERVTQLIESDRTGKAASWALASSDPHYRTAFRKILVDPMNGHREFTGDELGAFQRAAEENRALSLTDSAGGYMVPFTLDPNIVLTNAGVLDPMRQISRVETIATDTWNPVTSAGVSAEWIAEATEVAEVTPTLAQPTITPAKADAFVQFSVELQGDAVGIETELQRLLIDAKQRLEGAAFISGTGSGQPFGLMTRLGVTTASRVAGSSGAAGAATLTSADVYALAKALPPRHQPNASWLTNYATGYDVRQLATGSGPQHAFWADLGAATPPQLLGRPFYQSSEIDAAIVSGSNDDVLVLGDFSQYVVVDRVGATVELIPHILGSNRRPTLQRGLILWWRVGGDSINHDAWRYTRL